MSTDGDLRLFDLPEASGPAGALIAPAAPAVPDPAPAGSGPRETDPGVSVVRVLPDVPAIAKTFDYVVPEALRDHVRVGTVVRIELSGRRVRGWVLGPVDPTAGRPLLPLAKVTGWGPPAGIFDLADWAAWRWAGRRTAFVRTATADHAVPALPQRGPAVAGPGGNRTPVLHAARIEGALSGPGVAVVRLPPAADPFEIAATAVDRAGPALILVPSLAEARRMGVRLRRAGLGAATLPNDWAAVRAGRSAVGSRAAAWAPIESLGAVVVIDEHDEVYQEERTPTWHARDVAIERARRAGVPCVLVSPAPTLEALASADRVLTPSRVEERAGWPVVDVIDMRAEDPLRGGLLSERLARSVQDGARVVCVLNRKGRARQLACQRCETLARCERCSAAVGMDAAGDELACPRCALRRPVVCAGCGATKLRQIRLGVSRLRDDLQVLAPGGVLEVTGELRPDDDEVRRAQVLIGTEAVLHQLQHLDGAAGVDAVAFLDFDQELSAPRYRAAEHALALLIRAARVLVPKDGARRLLIQTRVPDHEVVQAAVHADPSRVSGAEAARRRQLRYPPFSAMAAISGAGAPELIASLPEAPDLDVLGPADGTWLLRAPDHTLLCDLLARTPRPAARTRVEVDPLRI